MHVSDIYKMSGDYTCFAHFAREDSISALQKCVQRLTGLVNALFMQCLI
jgi:hypothetical protein